MATLDDFLEYTILGVKCRPEVIQRVEEEIRVNPDALTELEILKNNFIGLDGVPLKTALEELQEQHPVDAVAKFIAFVNENELAQKSLESMGLNWK